MTYHAGKDIRTGDLINYAGSPGNVDFVVSEPTGDAAMDWYLKENSRGGVMIVAEGYGSVFLPDPEQEEDLDLVSRKP